MITLSFNGVDTKTGWGLSTAGLDFSSPSPKTHYADLRAADGKLDMTNFFGKVFYDTRHLTTILEAEGNYSAFMTKVHTVMDAIHGKRVKIKISGDSDYYYMGRCTVEAEKVNYQYGTITIDAECDPYRYKETAQNSTVTATAAGVTVTLTAETMPFIPVITCTNSGCTVTYGGHTYDLVQGENRLFELTPLTAGTHTYTIKGSGTVTVHYESGRL